MTMKELRKLLEKNKAKSIIVERGFIFCPTCGMALHLRVDEEEYCSFCGQKLNRQAPFIRE